MNLLVTGGAGYIGSHVCKVAAETGWNPVVVDNFSTGSRELVKWGEFIDLDIRETGRLTELMKQVRPSAVVHMAASSYVRESTRAPLDYYANNFTGMQSLLESCVESKVKRIVFSSSCAVYGLPDQCPISEQAMARPVNPYGETKLACERLLHWCRLAYGVDWLALRYFNAAGADPAGETGEVHDPETHLIPSALQCLSGKRDCLDIYGNDFNTADGFAVRDYIHVTDLAKAHILAVNYLLDSPPDLGPINLGAGKGYSVMEIVDAVKQVTGRPFKTRILARREGDPPQLYASTRLAETLLDWKPEFSDIHDIIHTAWRWEKKLSGIEPVAS